jgi:hypothetical protein
MINLQKEQGNVCCLTTLPLLKEPVKVKSPLEDLASPINSDPR